MKCTLVATAKNEGPYLLEWVAYHRMIGFTDILIFQNDSNDLTNETLKVLDRVGAVKYFYNRAKRGRHQVKAYIRAARQPQFRNADWAMALDLDEFLCIHAGRGDLCDLFDALPEAVEVLINWRRFGNDGQDELDDGLVVERFQSAEAKDRVAKMLTPFKTMFRPSHYSRCGIHQARGPLVPQDQILTVNGSGLTREDFEQLRFRIKDPKQRALAQVNHYITRDAASFVLKSDRGSAHQADRAIDQKYWDRRNFNQQRDGALAARADEVRRTMDTLDKASRGALSDLRAQSLDLHRARFQQLMNKPDFRALFEHCASA